MTETHLDIDGKTRLEAFKMMLDTPEFKRLFSEKTVGYLKSMVEQIHQDGYNKGFLDGGNTTSSIFDKIIGKTLEKN
jgi:hypothetical protein|tara:strand:- start:361 stop:591 length:231 start_codon:yes stop_codon:yes gene_type:complete